MILTRKHIQDFISICKKTLFIGTIALLVLFQHECIRVLYCANLQMFNFYYTFSLAIGLVTFY